ncbi:MAG: helix-hairpin-helix domain-containing protein [Planctomycetes bacterium]|nr:helix-hairpin-helix domain-containing protein [Planctomycetota bacterium]
MPARCFFTAVLLGCLAASAVEAQAPEPPAYVLLERVLGEEASGLPLMKEVAAGDPRRAAVDEVFARPFHRFVLGLGREARRLALARFAGPPEDGQKRFGQPAWFVLMDGGNRPQQGLAIQRQGGVEEYPDTCYVELDAEGAVTLIPHEYGHVMMNECLQGDLPFRPFSLPHTTGAISDAVTAFSEGFGIHFETLAGDRPENAAHWREVRRDDFRADAPPERGDSTRPAFDLMTYSQSYRRYTAIKENVFAFLPRVEERYVAGERPSAAELLARWTDTTYDPARLRTLEQMVASEGVIAALFYRLATTPDAGAEPADPAAPPLPDPRRYAAFFAAFSQLTPERLERAPAVLVFLEELLEAAGEAERRRIARVALEVFHYTLVLPDAAEIYASLHQAGHRLDIAGFRQRLPGLGTRFREALESYVADPTLPLARVAPEIWLRNDEVSFTLPILGSFASPLFLDLNTAPVEFLMSLPGVNYAQARAIAERRSRLGGFASLEDLAELPEITEDTLEELRMLVRE